MSSMVKAKEKPFISNKIVRLTRQFTIVMFLLAMLVAVIAYNQHQEQVILTQSQTPITAFPTPIPTPKPNFTSLTSTANVVAEKEYIEPIEIALAMTGYNNSIYLKNIYVVNQKEVIAVCSNKTETVGCNDIKYSINPYKVNTSNIYLSKLETYDGTLCNTFYNTLYHEIGHLDGALQSEALGKSEQYARDYANKFAKDKCHSDTYAMLKAQLVSSQEELNTTTANLEKWDKYSGNIPSDVYSNYVTDYSSYTKAFNNYNTIVSQLTSYLNSKDTLG